MEEKGDGKKEKVGRKEGMTRKRGKKERNTERKREEEERKVDGQVIRSGFNTVSVHCEKENGTRFLSLISLTLADNHDDIIR